MPFRYEVAKPMLGGIGLSTGPVTVNAKFCVAALPTPFEAVNMSWNTPLAIGMPLRVPVPFRLSVKCTPLGSAPACMMVGAGYPVVVTINEFEPSSTKVVLFALVIVGDWLTVKVKLCVALGLTPLLAVKVIGNNPPTVGIPLSVPVPSWLSTNDRPSSVDADSPTLGIGDPVVFIVNEFAWPTVKVALLALVMVGAAGGVPVVMVTHHPPPMLDAALAEFAIAYKDQVPFGAVLANVVASVAVPSAAA